MVNLGDPRSLEALMNPDAIEAITSQARVIKRAMPKLEKIRNQLGELELTIETDGWRPEMENGVLDIIKNLNMLKDRYPDMAEIVDKLKLPAYKTLENHQKMESTYNALLKQGLSRGDLKKIGKVITNPYDGHRTELLNSFNGLTQLIEMPAQAEQAKQAWNVYRKKGPEALQTYQLQQQLYTAIAILAAVGGLSAVSLSNIPTGQFISTGIKLPIFGFLVLTIIALAVFFINQEFKTKPKSLL